MAQSGTGFSTPGAGRCTWRGCSSPHVGLQQKSKPHLKEVMSRLLPRRRVLRPLTKLAAGLGDKREMAWKSTCTRLLYSCRPGSL